MFPFKRDAVVWHPKGKSRDGARSADDVRALGAGNPLVTGRGGGITAGRINTILLPAPSSLQNRS